MQLDDISKISQEINARVKEAEKGLADETFNPYVDRLQNEPVNLAEAEEDLSEIILERIKNLSRKSVSSSQIIKLLRESSHPRFASLNVVPNEIASVIVGEIEIGLPSDAVRKVKSLSVEEFGELKRMTKVKYPRQDAQSLLIDCRFDRWTLIVDEDKFLEKTALLVKGSNQEI